MANFKKLLSAPAAAGGGLNVEDVFSTYLYDGNNTTNPITNGIDLAGEGGLVWIKSRTTTDNNYLIGSDSNWASVLSSNTTGIYGGAQNVFDGVSSTGFTVKGDFGGINASGQNYASWTFRKAPKFFDVVTYTGNSVAGREIAHNLGTTVGTVIIKCTSNARNWRVWHRSLSTGQSMVLNSTGTVGTTNILNSTAPTDSVLTLSSDADVNNNGFTYVAYLFAHNDGDGNFGPTGDQDIIKCGTYTGNASTDGPEIDLGWEPQWLLVKATTDTGGWALLDNMRGFGVEVNNFLYANQNVIENPASNIFRITPTGFKLVSSGSGYNYPSGTNYIYIAIRRGPMAIPESGSDVFAIDTYGGTLPNPPAFNSGFPVDMALVRNTGSGENWDLGTRLLQGTSLRPNGTNAEDTGYSSFKFDYQDGFYNGTGVVSNYYSWMWRRAPNYFDVVTYTGTGSAQNITHNLGATPEFYIVKRRDSTGAWYAYHKDIDKDGDGLPETDAIQFNANTAAFDSASYWNDTAPTEATFTVGTTSAVNASGGQFIAYLFTSLSGVAKVGGYTGNGTSQTINCGFSPRFVFLTAWGPVGGGPKLVWDTERGIVAGNDPFLDLSSTAAEDSSYDFIDPDSNGFVINSSSGWVNDSGQGYMFYAIA